VLDPRGHGEADGVECLGRERRGQRSDAVQVRVEAAVPAPREEREELNNVDPSGECADGLAVGWEEPVIGLEREDRADLRCLLTMA
jgi:hypothetical protein